MTMKEAPPPLLGRAFALPGWVVRNGYDSLQRCDWNDEVFFDLILHLCKFHLLISFNTFNDCIPLPL
jgi:hypothetical protein